MQVNNDKGDASWTELRRRRLQGGRDGAGPGGAAGLIDQGALSGAVTLVWRKGEVVQVNTLGQRDIAKGLPMERDTLFRIASMTKPVTSVAAMMLVEEGKLKLDDPITKWIPSSAACRC
jgi:CubicO group peptidase (beta-lactamase class C family)